MPIFLKAPAHNPAGPDGQGWNRISLASMAGDECALQPTSYAALVESQDTRRARYGGFGPCARAGQCATCPVYNASPRELRAFTDRILVRADPRDGQPWLLNHPERGWVSLAYRWTWAELARVPGWTVGDPHHDEHGEGFWLHRAPPPQQGDPASVDRFTIIARQVRERWTIAFPKTTVTEVGVEPEGQRWQGTVERLRFLQRKALGGKLVELQLSNLTMADRPGRLYDRTVVLLRVDDVVEVVGS